MEYFDELHLESDILKGIRKIGFTKMTPIQQKAIPLLLEGRDVVGQAQTGTGKTGAYGIPLVSRIDPNLSYTQGLILAPTRELATQITSHIRAYAKYTDLRIMCFHGGGKIERQMSLLRYPVHIIVATPGRILDLIRRKKAANISRVKVAVIDEADKMLEMGFMREVGDILSQLPFVRQTSLWSATISEEVLQISTRYMRHPRKVIVSKKEIAQENVQQFMLLVNEYNREQHLFKILDRLKVDRGLIFCNTRELVEKLTETLQKEGYLVDAIHGGFIQSQRDQAYTKLLKRQIKYLVSTDVASRGLDIKGLTHIINYQVPEDPEVYFHRIGRTARQGREGKSISLVSPKEHIYWEAIRKMTSTPILEYDIDYLCNNHI
jgi:ATP-dependent RNA helicase DeaD